MLPDGRPVAIDQFVGENFKNPRTFHPEYALAIELLLANAVTEAKSRGFQVSSVELGVWSYRTLITLGKRVTKIGLPEPMLKEDGRTETRVGYMWIDHDSEGVMLVPWANGDQLIRIKDSRGYYVVPVDERTALPNDRVKQTMSWRNVQEYPPLSYTGGLAWGDVPLLEASDPMVEQRPCPQCKFLLPISPWPFVIDIRKGGEEVCEKCFSWREEQREIAASQGWDWDCKAPIMAPRHFATLVNPAKEKKECIHKWGMQMSGISNAVQKGGMKVSFECIFCGKPTPTSELSVRHLRLKQQQDDAIYKKRMS